MIGGWLPGEGRRERRIGALLMGVYEPGGAFRYAGRVGTGFSDSELDRLAELLAPLERADSPFTAGERRRAARSSSSPSSSPRSSSASGPPRGSLRHPSYKGLREDKAASEVVREDFTVAHAADADELATGGRRPPSSCRSPRRAPTARAPPCKGAS